jgi:NAD(P)-dependent dehydrogenase (short-subunit alcohol dehydrogenase family)
MNAIDAVAKKILADHGTVEFLVNNAGRSIRRAVINSLDRFHDFERTMQLNYFGAVRLILAFLPQMVAQKRGHIINISSIGVLSRAPRFSAYVASKSALDAFAECAASEFLDKGIHFTNINMPLVRTPMIAPTKMYENVPTLSPEEAAGLVVEAIVYRPVRIATRLGIFGAGLPRARTESDAGFVEHRVQHVPGLGCRARQERTAANRSSSHPSRWPLRN